VAARTALVPVLQAEEDRRYCAARALALRAESSMMAHVPGWRAGESPYNSGRWMPPALSMRPSVHTS
jgi:NADH dehydrogenase (ubiquinone) 1 alpha subcomplex subunit 13